MSCLEASPILQGYWNDTYKPGATGLDGAYAGRSYWVCTYNWPGQGESYPIAEALYDVALSSGFATGYTPTFAIIGFNNKVYYDDYILDNFTTALNLAIDEFYRPIYVSAPIEDRCFLYGFSENIDLTTVFTESEGNPMEFSLYGNSNPGVVSAVINGNILTIEGTVGEMAESSISVQAVSGENSVFDEFKVSSYDPTTFSNLQQSFESEFPPPFWEIKYNTAADGGLNGTNLIDPIPGEETWFQNTPSTQDYGSDYIHTGNSSALIKYWAPEFNWLISPPMQLNFNDYDLKFWVWFSSSVYETKFHILVDDGSKSWTSILNWDISSPDNEYSSEVSLSLADYSGKTVRIAFIYEYSDGFELALDDIRVESPSGIETGYAISDKIELYQNYPNPFNPNTKIDFTLAKYSDVKLSVYNLKGELVRTVYEGKLAKGFHQLDFDGAGLTTGVYFYELKTSENALINKMMLLK